MGVMSLLLQNNRGARARRGALRKCVALNLSENCIILVSFDTKKMLLRAYLAKKNTDKRINSNHKYSARRLQFKTNSFGNRCSRFGGFLF